jgi:hypothetical protein
VTQAHRVSADAPPLPLAGGPLSRRQGDAGPAYAPDDAGSRATGTWGARKRAARARTAPG